MIYEDNDMRFVSVAAAIISTMMAVPSFAGGVAVADAQAAIMGTDVAKAAFDKLANELKPQRTRIETLQKDIATIEEKFKKNSAVMAEKDKKDLEKQWQSKVTEYKSAAEAYQQRAEEVKQDVLNKLLPKAEVVIEDLRKAGNYDVVIDKRNVILSSKDVDITKQIIDKLNAAK